MRLCYTDKAGVISNWRFHGMKDREDVSVLIFWTVLRLSCKASLRILKCVSSVGWVDSRVIAEQKH